MTTHVKAFFQTAVAVTVLVFAGAATAQDTVSKSDKEFLKDAAEMGAAEVQMGKLGQEKAIDPQLKKLAAELVRDHSKANDKLMALAKKKGVEVAAEPTSAQKRMLTGLAEKSGEEFDKEYREHAAKSHQKGIKMMQEAAKDSKDEEIKAFASAQIPVMQEHLAMAKEKGNMRTTERRQPAPGAAPKQDAPGGANVKTE